MRGCWRRAPGQRCPALSWRGPAPSPAPCPGKARTETAQGSGDSAGQDTACPAGRGQPCASRLRDSRAGAWSKTVRSQAPWRPRHPQPCSAGGPRGYSELGRDTPLVAPSLYRASRSWGSRRGRVALSRPIPPRSRKPAPRGPRAVSLSVCHAGQGGGQAVPAESAAVEFTGTFTKKKVIWKKAKRGGADVKSAGFKEGFPERSKLLLRCARQQQSPRTAGAHGRSLSRSLPRGAASAQTHPGSAVLPKSPCT